MTPSEENDFTLAILASGERLALWAAPAEGVAVPPGARMVTGGTGTLRTVRQIIRCGPGGTIRRRYQCIDGPRMRARQLGETRDSCGL